MRGGAWVTGGPLPYLTAVQQDLSTLTEKTLDDVLTQWTRKGMLCLYLLPPLPHPLPPRSWCIHHREKEKYPLPQFTHSHRFSPNEKSFKSNLQPTASYKTLQLLKLYLFSSTLQHLKSGTLSECCWLYYHQAKPQIYQWGEWGSNKDSLTHATMEIHSAPVGKLVFTRLTNHKNH